MHIGANMVNVNQLHWRHFPILPSRKHRMRFVGHTPAHFLPMKSKPRGGEKGLKNVGIRGNEHCAVFTVQQGLNSSTGRFQ